MPVTHEALGTLSYKLVCTPFGCPWDWNVCCTVGAWYCKNLHIIFRKEQQMFLRVSKHFISALCNKFFIINRCFRLNICTVTSIASLVENTSQHIVNPSILLTKDGSFLTGFFVGPTPPLAPHGQSVTSTLSLKTRDTSRRTSAAGKLHVGMFPHNFLPSIHSILHKTAARYMEY